MVEIIYVSSIDQVEPKLIELVDNPKLQMKLINNGDHFVSNFFVNKGNSSEAIANFCKKIVDENNEKME